MERNLYLTSQMIEMKIPLIVVLNMMDVAASRKIKIEIDHLAKHLGCQVISMVANKKKGIEELKNNIGELLKDIKIPTSAVEYDSMIEEAIKELIPIAEPYACLLYTSDAADDTPCVDLGGRRIIKKKKD
eukprot:TRINITY_DN15926_c0_g1_i2.p2 TRINITY_DN15926_c0_g1~~TRINITY_DN15926_c0_g1_i2.p2  ORF type:complete len:130 (-),score=39.77 TRINITY_DN15926_c0_g1_i2:87-476(-)